MTIPKVNPEMPNGKRRIFNVLRPSSVISQTPNRNPLSVSNNNLNINNNKLINEGLNNQENKSNENRDNSEEIIKPIAVNMQPKESLVKSVMDKINSSNNINPLNEEEEEKKRNEIKENIDIKSPKKENLKLENIFDDQEFFKIPYSLTREWVIKNFNLKK